LHRAAQALMDKPE